MDVKDILMDDETLFRQERVFTPTYVPDDFMHRDPQLEELALALKPGMRGVNPSNSLIYGPAGTGKTTAVRYVFQQVKETSDRLVPVYINCEDSSTPYAIFSRIYEEVYGLSPPSTGKPLEDVKERVFTKLSRMDKSLVVALDELDRLFLNKQVENILIDLLKSHSTYDYDRVGILGIMIRDQFLLQLSEKTRSVFNPSYIHFEPYSRDQVQDILERRVQHGFYPNVMSAEVLDIIVDYTYERGDLRFGIELLRRSGVMAENDSSKSIEEEHVEQAVSRLQTNPSAEELSEDMVNLLEIIREQDGETSGRIYKTARGELGFGIKKYNQLIKELEHKNLIKSEYIKGRGRSRKINVIDESSSVE